MIKKLLQLGFSATAASILLLVSCEKEGTEDSTAGPAITISTAVVNAASDGGSYSFTYTLTNAVDGGEMACATDASWLFDANVGSGTVTFVVAANSDSDRNGHITLTYKYESGSLTKTVTVVQGAGLIPELTVQPVAVVADADGGAYSFTYTVTNPVSDAEINCVADVDWIHDFDYSVSGKVSFFVDDNPEYDLRMGYISVDYIYSGSISETVAVAQAHAPKATGGDGDITEVIGTYTCSGKTLDTTDQTGMGLIDATWTVKIFEYTGTEDYDIYIDGISNQYAGSYDLYGDHRFSAGAYYYSDGRIEIPSQVITTSTVSLGGYSYYLAYTPCVQYDTTNGFYLDRSWPSTTFTAVSDDTHTSDYGVMAAACSNTSISSMTYILDGSIPTLTLTKTSGSTSSLQSRPDTTPIHPVGESPYLSTGFVCE